MKKDLTKVKTRLIELGYIDNEWLDKYLELIEANLETKKSKKSTQAHHAIPVNSYWTSDEPYNRREALKLAQEDKVNFVVNLLYKDHLIIHSYLTLCTNLETVQLRYEAQANLRECNSSKARRASTPHRGKHYLHKGTEVILVSPEDLATKLSEGWLPGKKDGAKFCHVNQNGKYKVISVNQLETYLQDGWTYGAIGRTEAKTKITKSITNLKQFYSDEEIEDILDL